MVPTRAAPASVGRRTARGSTRCGCTTGGSAAGPCGAGVAATGAGMATAADAAVVEPSSFVAVTRQVTEPPASPATTT